MLLQLDEGWVLHAGSLIAEGFVLLLIVFSLWITVVKVNIRMVSFSEDFKHLGEHEYVFPSALLKTKYTNCNSV